MASRLIAFYAEVAAAKRTSAIAMRGYCTDLALVTFTVDPPRIKATERSSKASSIKVGRGMSQYIEPLGNSNSYAAFMVQRGHFHQTMIECEYEASHVDSERDYKAASFKVQQYKAKQKTLADGEELTEEELADLEKPEANLYGRCCAHEDMRHELQVRLHEIHRRGKPRLQI